LIPELIRKERVVVGGTGGTVRGKVEGFNVEGGEFLGRRVIEYMSM
jgi:hypothetical protein